MKQRRLSSPVRWVTGLIVFAAASLITLFWSDRSPSRTLQRLGFSDESIRKIRNGAKHARYRFSVDDTHPSYFRATFNEDTNHLVPDEITINTRAFVRESAEDFLGDSIDYKYLRRCVFSGYGTTRVLELPDGKLLYTHAVAQKWQTAILLQVYDPATQQACSQPTTITERYLRNRDIILVPHDEESLFTFRRLRSDSSFELGIRSEYRNGTDLFDRYYTYYQIDEQLNLVPMLEHLQFRYRTAMNVISSSFHKPGENELLLKFAATPYLQNTQQLDLGWHRFEWNIMSNAFEIVERKMTYSGDHQIKLYLDDIFPEIDID